jgi:hypothetical protein
MKKNLFLITEEEKRRILGLHQSATKRGYLSEQEQTVQYYKDQTGKVIKLVGNYSIPLESTPATPEEYDAQNKPVEGGGGQGAKVITNNDKSYDYKEENGKYYYSKKGQNQWVEAKGDINNPKSPLGAIKNLKWDTATPMPSPTNGAQGTSGTAGTSGTQGTSGTAGVAGTSGTAGVAGTSVVQVKSKLIELKPGMIGKGFMQDTAEGKTYKVIKSTDLPCGITEVQFKRNEEQFTSNNKTFEYGYYKPSEQNDDYPNKIGFRRLGEGVKDADPCKNFESFGDFGDLDFS